ncbi:MAG: ABC transporter substrate-binding protein [Roseiflexaceae bacterium]|nr:ABC transporter substrate-binding protein [Roseiflexaceae bacterium]
MMRIVSLLPSATEIVCELELADMLVGVSHECDYPPDVVADLPRVTRSAIPHGLSSAEIDQVVSARLARGESLYLLEETLLAELRPDLVITQELCDVCAVSFADVCTLAARLPGNPRVVSLAPPNLESIFGDVLTIAEAVGMPERGRQLTERLRQRLDRVHRAVAGQPRPGVVALEWLDPPFIGGHWVPEMIHLAGGRDLLGRAGERSFRVRWEDVINAQPDVVLLIPCGYSAEAAQREWDALPRPPGWFERPGGAHGPRVCARRQQLLFAPGAAGSRRGRTSGAPVAS